MRAGPVDAGCLGGIAYCVGNCYGLVGGHISGELGLPAIVRGELVYRKEDGPRARFAGILSLLGATVADENVRALVLQKNTELAVSVYALILAFHLGFDPEALVREAISLSELALGGDEPDPPAPVTRAFPVQDELDDVPYQLVSHDDLALVDSGSATERERQRLRVVRELGEPTGLVRGADDAHELWVAPRRILRAASVSAETADALARTHEREREEAFTRASHSNDPRAIADALDRFPFAPDSEQAPLLRRRGELLLEQGDVEEARACFEEEASRTPEAQLESVRERLAALDGLREQDVTATSSWSGSAMLDGRIMGAQGRAVWAMTASGDVAWENPDALPEDCSESKTIGAARDLLLLEVQPRVEEHEHLRRAPSLAAPSANRGELSQ